MMKPSDRFLRAAFVALAVGLGWGIRGDFGHSLGASYPGAALGLAFAFVASQESMFRRMPILGALGAIGISLGGKMSYGILHGYAQSDTFINYAYGFFTLFMEGGTWGLFGCALIGLSLENKCLRVSEWLSVIGTTLAAGFLFYGIVVMGLGFHVNPPRSDISVGFTGAAIGLFAWLAYFKKASGLKASVLGLVGFGLGMSTGRLLGNIANIAQHNSVWPFTINHWNVMECSVGLIGGFIFAWGMLGREFPAVPEGRRLNILSACSLLYVLFLIPLLHRVTRINGEKIDGWMKTIPSFGYDNPAGVVSTTLTLMSILLGAALLGTFVAIWLHRSGAIRFSWFPVMCLSLTMLLFQNLGALFPYYPHQPGQINMHIVFWVFFGLMVLYIVFGKRAPLTAPDEDALDSHWRGWVITALAGYLVILIGAMFVNGDETMKSACTRWPIWSHSDGPFPGRELSK